MKKMDGLVDYIFKAIKEYFQADNGRERPSRGLNQVKLNYRGMNGNGSNTIFRDGNSSFASASRKLKEEGRGKTIDLMDYWRIILKRKWVAISFSTLTVIIVGILTFTATPLYRASATIHIDEPASNMLSIQEMFNYNSYPRYDYMNQYLNTQLKLLRSRSMAERVVRAMDLRHRPEVVNSQKSNQGIIHRAKNLFSKVKRILALNWVKKAQQQVVQEAEPLFHPDPYARWGFYVLRGLNVTPVKDTRLVSLSFTSPYPVLAADIVNTLAEEFIKYSIETRYEATQQASEFLSEQIANLREDLASKERALQRYGEEKKLFFLSDKESTVVSKFADLNEAYTQAQIERIKMEAAFRELKNLKVDSLPPFVSNPLIQSLRADYTRIKNDYEEKSKFFKPDYPEMVKIRAKLQSIRNELESEIRKAAKSAESEYRSALNKERSLKALLNEQKRNVIETNNNAILYNSLKIEVENKRKLLNSLVARQNETLISARLGGLNSSTVRIVDKALVPGHPISPDKKGNLLLALLLGIVGGIGLVFIMDYLDNTIKGPEDVERIAGLPSLGVIPNVGKNGKAENIYNYYHKHKYRNNSYRAEGQKKEVELPEIKEIELINHYYPKIFLAEDYRTIRTSIMLSDGDVSSRVLAVTSALPQEGKTATLANLAISFAQLNKKVLIIDADMRRPRLHRIFNIGKYAKGLSSYLAKKCRIEDVIHKTAIDNLFLLPSGPFPPYPGELLGTARMRELVAFLRDYFDVILLDTPPVLSVSDAVLVCSIVDGAIVVVYPEKTTKKDFAQAVDDIQKSKTHVIGVVFNNARVRKKGYYSSYYKHKHYYYSSYGEEESTSEGVNLSS